MIPYASTFAFIKSIDLQVVKRNIRTHLINMGKRILYEILVKIML